MSDLRIYKGDDRVIPAQVVDGTTTLTDGFDVQVVPLATGEERPTEAGWAPAPVTTEGLERGYFCVYTRYQVDDQTFIDHARDHVHVQ